MRYWHRPSFWIVFIFGEFLAYLLAAYSTLFVIIILGGVFRVGDQFFFPWLIPLPIGLFAWLSYQVFRLARRRASRDLPEPAGFDVIVRPAAIALPLPGDTPASNERAVPDRSRRDAKPQGRQGDERGAAS
jgi:hypothetical protein